MKHFLKVDDFSKQEILYLLKRADLLQYRWQRNLMPRTLKGRRVALWFYGNGFRNRTAFEIGARALGADVSFIPGELGVHEPIEDIARYLDNWFSLKVIRCRNYRDLAQVAQDSIHPVINARTDRNHPCEIMGDLQYIRKIRGTLNGLNVVFVGEPTNLCMSWFEAARVLPIRVLQVAPEGFTTPTKTLEEYNRGAAGTVSTSVSLEESIRKDVDVLYTDCWPKDRETKEIREKFLPYQITGKIV